MDDKIRIGSYQGPIADNDFECNLRKAEDILSQTRDMRLDFLCFPETFLTGYFHRAVRESSLSLNDVRLVDFIKRTTDYDTVILISLSERDNDKIER
jgi:predicted amidohydrolase